MTRKRSVLPNGIVWPKIVNFDERILLFGKMTKSFYVILLHTHFRRGF